MSTSCDVAGTDTYVWNLLVQYILHGSIGKDGVVVLTGHVFLCVKAWMACMIVWGCTNSCSLNVTNDALLHV